MFTLSRRFGALADRFGPRLFMAGGPILAGAGLLLLARVDAHPDYVTQILPGVLVFALGLAATVAPLTATVLGSVRARPLGPGQRHQQRDVADRGPARDRRGRRRRSTAFASQARPPGPRPLSPQARAAIAAHAAAGQPTRPGLAGRAIHAVAASTPRCTRSGSAWGSPRAGRARWGRRAGRDREPAGGAGGSPSGALAEPRRHS